MTATLLHVAGCSEWQFGEQREPVAETRLPAFVYPVDPPLVGAEQLRNLLVRIDSEKTLLWVFDEEGLSAETAGMLSARKDELRYEGVELIGLYTGPPEQWSTRVVPTLRAADANFACAVADPRMIGGLAGWLSRTSSSPEPGLYVLSHDRRVLSRTQADAASMTGLLESLLAVGQPASMPFQPATLRAVVRFVDLQTGATLARAEAEAADPPGLAALLAGQLAQVPASSPVAVLPFREPDRKGVVPLEAGLLVADRLGRDLAAAGWLNLVSAHQARDTLTELGITPLAVEFAPGELLERTGWKAILVGSINSARKSDHP